jgi:predicted small secreted protein
LENFATACSFKQFAKHHSQLHAEAEFLLCHRPPAAQSWRVKYLIILVTVFALNSCNTLIGIGRDTQKGCQWTAGKLQGMGGNSGGSEY